jgi:hypothetical protein
MLGECQNRFSLTPAALDTRGVQKQAPGSAIRSLRLSIRDLKVTLLLLLAVLAVSGSVVQAVTFTFKNVLDNSGSFDSFADKPAINNGGVVAFRAGLKSGVRGIYRSDGAAAITIADTSTGDFAFNPFPMSLESRCAVNDAGTVAFFIYHYNPTNYFEPSVCTGSGGAVAVIAVAYSNPDIGGGQVAFVAGLPATNSVNRSAVFVAPAGGGAATIVAQTDDRFGNSFDGPSINASGQVAFYAGLTIGADGIFLGPNGATNIVQGGAGSCFEWLQSGLMIGDGGQVIFTGRLTNGVDGVFYGSGGPLAGPITLSGGDAIGDIGTFPSLNAAGTVLCHGRLPDNRSAILAGDGTEVEKVIAVDDSLFGSTVTALGDTGNHGLNNSGQIVFTYELANGVQGIAVATPATVPPLVQSTLEIQRVDPLHVQLAWTTNAAGFKLESVSSLPTLTWNAVTNTPFLNGHQFTVVAEVGGAAQFFRLRSP